MEPEPSSPSETPEPSPWRRRGLIGLAVLLVLGVIAQPVRLRVLAAAIVADGLDLAVPRPFAPEIERRQAVLAGIEADLYGPPAEGVLRADDGPSATGLPPEADGKVVLLVPGATPAGRDDRRVVALAEAFARGSRVVVVPELDVYQEDLVPEDIERIVQLVMALDDAHGPVTLTGISFGGSLSLVAAGDPRLDGRVALVGTFGAYVDLGGVVQAATTGVALVDDRRFPWDADPRAADVVRDQILRLLTDQDREELRQALDGVIPPTALRSEIRAAYDLLRNDDPARTPVLLEQLPQVVRDRVTAVSPARAVPDLDVPVVALHARDDPVIPYGELRRLGTVYPEAELISLTTFDHVGIDPEQEVSWWVTASDLWRTTRFVSRVLGAQS